jgi:polar amino acid transport system substrate-binding protein
MKKLFIILLIVSAVFTAGAQTLTSAWEFWEPFQYTDANGKLKGIDIEIITAAMKKAGLSPDFKEMPWNRVINLIKTGELNFAGGASKTEERMEFAYFSDSYRKESAVIYVNKGKKYNIKSLDDIVKAGFKLGVTTGYYYGEEYERLIKNPAFKALIQEVSSDSLNYKKLQGGRIDGFLIEPLVGEAEFKNLGISGQFEALPFTAYADDIYVMFSKKTVNIKTVEAFNKGLAEIKKSGEYQKILNSYIK